jgi:PASTA domain
MIFAAPPPPDYNAQCGEFACRVERVPTRWYLDGVGHDPSTLKLVYLSGGCRQGDGRAHVTETRSRIRIAVDESEVVAMDTPEGEDFACTSDLRLASLRVRLERAVAGRRVAGPHRVKGLGLGGFDERVPRVIGLAAVDAAAVLRDDGFKVRRFVHRSGTVAFQSPLPGTRTRRPQAGITLGWDGFDARALTSCVRGARIRAVAGRPEHDDPRVPDLELVLSSTGAPGLVALYADPARATDTAAMIRRNVRGTNAIVERLGRATFVWFRQPDPALRAHVVGCVAGARP